MDFSKKIPEKRKIDSKRVDQQPQEGAIFDRTVSSTEKGTTSRAEKEKPIQRIIIKETQKIEFDFDEKIPLLDDQENWENRAFTLIELGGLVRDRYITDPQQLNIIKTKAIELLNDPRWEVRVDALWTLDQLGAKNIKTNDLIAALIEMNDKDTWQVKYNTSRLLLKLGQNVRITGTLNQQIAGKEKLERHHFPMFEATTTQKTLPTQEKTLPKLSSTPLPERQGQKATTGLIERFFQKIYHLLGWEKPEPRPPIQLTVDGLGTFEVLSHILPNKPAALTEEAFHKTISEKIQRGHALCKEILNGQKIGATATQEQISDLMWYLQIKSESKAGPFDSGSISIQDPNLHLLNFLDSNKEVYQRLSSHVKEFQNFEGEIPSLDEPEVQGKSGVHRGIDFNHPNDLNTCLPYGMLTLMVAPMFADTGLIKENRILLKMEEHGAFISMLKKKYEHAPVSRAFNRHDIGHAFGHGFGFIKSFYRTHFGNQTAAGTRRERIDKNLANEYANFIKELKDQGKSDQAKILEEKDPLSTSGGIRIMAENLASLDPNVLTDAMRAFYIKITQLDHYDVRIGNEVILDQNELI